MSRVKTGPSKHKRHVKVLAAASGFLHARHKRYKVAHEAVMHAGQYAYEGRKLKKRDFRRLWISRINAGLKNVDQNLSYSVFIKLLADNKIEINRKMLSEMTINFFEDFKTLVNQVYGR